LERVLPLNDNEGSPEPGGSLPTHQSTAKLGFCVLSFWSLPGGLARAGAAEAQVLAHGHQPARQRWDSLPTVVVVLLGRGHPLSFLKAAP